MILAIVGSQNIDEEQTVVAKALIFNIFWAFGGAHDDMYFGVISGGANGVDSLVKEVLEENDPESYDTYFTEYLPENPRWEPDGYKDRNIRIATDADVLWCIRSRQTKTYGSGWTADYAESIGKKVYRVFV